MLRKNILYLFHDSKFCNKICSINHPWGWKDKSQISNENNKRINNNNFFSYHKNENEKDFLKNTIYPYNLIYKTFINNYNFLDYQYTNPQLSIVLNKIRSITNDKLLLELPKEITNIETKIISNEFKFDFFTCNTKFLGYFNKEEIYKEIIKGMAGPENEHFWNERPLKQVINVLYKSEHFYDTLEWERDMTLEEPQWQVSNINYIIYSKNKL